MHGSSIAALFPLSRSSSVFVRLLRTSMCCCSLCAKRTDAPACVSQCIIIDEATTAVRLATHRFVIAPGTSALFFCSFPLLLFRIARRCPGRGNGPISWPWVVRANTSRTKAMCVRRRSPRRVSISDRGSWSARDIYLTPRGVPRLSRRLAARRAPRGSRGGRSGRSVGVSRWWCARRGGACSRATNRRTRTSRPRRSARCSRSSCSACGAPRRSRARAPTSPRYRTVQYRRRRARGSYVRRRAAVGRGS